MSGFFMGRIDRPGWVLLFVLTASLFFQIGCEDFGDGSSGGGDDDDDMFDDDDDDGGYDDDDDDDDDYYDDDAGDDDDDSTPPPPEPEEDIDPGTRPRICDGAVFVLNEQGDFVSRIDMVSLDVDTIEVGHDPVLLRATNDCRTMVTLNAGEDTVSIIDTQSNEVQTAGIRPDLNALVLSPDNHYALAFHQFVANGGSHGYGEISIVDLTTRAVRSLAIGFPPDQAVVTPDNKALLASETTLAIVDLTDGGFSTVDMGLDLNAGQVLKKVMVTADAAYAFLLAEASTALKALDLSNMTVADIELECYPTDLDVAENGDVSLALCRQDGHIFVIDNRTLNFVVYETEEVVGSGELASDGALALLFTNAEAIERVHVFDPADGSLTTLPTYKPLIGAAIAPQDRTAILFHYGGDFEPIDDFDAYLDTREAFSIMNLTDMRINTIEVPQTPLLVSFDEQGRNGIIPLPDYRQVALAHLDGGLADVIAMPSTPLEVGLLADLNLGFVLQDHSLGRISFVDVETLEVRTITGFLLNGGIGQ